MTRNPMFSRPHDVDYLIEDIAETVAHQHQASQKHTRKRTPFS